MTDEIGQLRTELERLQRRFSELEQPESDVSRRSEEEPVGRRGFLRAIGTVAAGATVGTLAFAQPASALDGESIVLGSTSNDGDSPTLISSNSGFTASPSVGILHVTNDTGTDNANFATSCISAIATGVGGGAHTVAFAGSGSTVGAKLDGPVPLKLSDSTNSPAPTSASGILGQFKLDDGDLWFCTTGTLGGSATWRRITGDGDAGMFNAIQPFRVYDSRFAGGPVSPGDDRIINCRDALNVSDGTVSVANAVPVGAQAITFNLTVVNTVGGGFLTVAPSTAVAITASSINWDNSLGGALANGTLSALGGDRQVKVFARGTGDYIIDVTGYYL